ncbi:EAL domain-containing protein [Congregibacter sp.]|uniref:EAL domain-containing protein n=1 Tax=Congregibacter sp. TaxID=2744308 RepID=UPI003F6ADF33
MGFGGLTRPYRWANGVKLACYGQQIVNATTRRVDKVELLSRPVGGGDIPDLEAFFQKLPVEAHLDLVKWHVQIAREVHAALGVPVCINVDNQIFLEERYTHHLYSLIERNRLPLVFEFTEMNPMPSVDRVHPVFRRLREHSVQIALDDFGAGFNGMSLFTDYDFDIVKIDRALVKDVAVRAKKAQVLGLLADMITTLGKSHVVEGLETEEQLMSLQRLGFTTFQGFFFHRPDMIDRVIKGLNLQSEKDVTNEISLVQ